MISTIPGADICHDGFGSLALDYASKEGPRCKAAKKAAAGPLPSMGDEVKSMELRIREEDTMTRNGSLSFRFCCFRERSPSPPTGTAASAP